MAAHGSLNAALSDARAGVRLPAPRGLGLYACGAFWRGDCRERVPVEFRTLGPLQLFEAGQALALGSGLQRALLALLVVHVPEPVSVDRLIDELWRERPPATAQHALQVYVSAIRKILRSGDGEVGVRNVGSGYALDIEPDRVDARRFERLVGEAQQVAAADPAHAGDLFGEALGLWRGPPLAEFAQFEFACREADRLEELHAVAVEGVVKVRLACGEHADVLGMITGLVAASSLRERPRRLPMLAPYRSGRHAEALAAYRDARTALAELRQRASDQIGALNNLGSFLLELGETDRGRALVEEALELSRGVGAPRLVAQAAGNLAEEALIRGDLDRAEPLIREALQNSRQISFSSAISWVLSLDALLALQRSELQTAEERMSEALTAIRGTYDFQTGQIVLAVGAAVATTRGEPLTAAQLWAALHHEINTHPAQNSQLVTQLRDQWLKTARAASDTTAWEAAWTVGTKLHAEQAREIAART